MIWQTKLSKNQVTVKKQTPFISSIFEYSLKESEKKFVVQKSRANSKFFFCLINHGKSNKGLKPLIIQLLSTKPKKLLAN